MASNRLHAFIDDIQIDLGEIHNQVEQTWFGYATEQIEQTVTA